VDNLLILNNSNNEYFTVLNYNAITQLPPFFSPSRLLSVLRPRFPSWNPPQNNSAVFGSGRIRGAILLSSNAGCP